VLEALVMRSDCLPLLIKIDEETPIVFVDTAWEKRLQHVAPQCIVGLLSNHASSLHIIAIMSQIDVSGKGSA